MTPDDMREGITRSLKKCEEHLRGAEVLTSNGCLNAAVVLVEFALEEFGRAIELRDRLNAGSTQVELRLFRDHDLKYDKAWTILNQDLKKIYEGTFDPAIFDPHIFDTQAETISPRTRLDAAFVNYVNGTWIDTVRADRGNLERLIEGIREEINNFQIP